MIDEPAVEGAGARDGGTTFGSTLGLEADGEATV